MCSSGFAVTSPAGGHSKNGIANPGDSMNIESITSEPVVLYRDDPQRCHTITLTGLVFKQYPTTDAACPGRAQSVAARHRVFKDRQKWENRRHT